MPIVYGRHPVEEILGVARDQVEKIVVDRLDRLDGIAVDPITVVVDAARLEEITHGGNHQGIAAVLGDFRYTPLSAALSIERGCVMLLDQVQDPHNLGAILRSAAALGAAAVIIPKDRAVAVSDTAIRTSAGLAYRVPVVQVTNIARTLGELAEAGFWSVGLTMDGDTELREVDLGGKIALVLGGEGSGIRRLVLEKCDFRARIAMQDDAESLNVSVASGIALYEWRRQTPV